MHIYPDAGPEQFLLQPDIHPVPLHPSSQDSDGVTNPSPHMAEQTEAVVTLPYVQEYNGFTHSHPSWHPIPSFDPSSHVSFPATRLSPHFVEQTLG